MNWVEYIPSLTDHIFWKCEESPKLNENVNVKSGDHRYKEKNEHMKVVTAICDCKISYLVNYLLEVEVNQLNF